MAISAPVSWGELIDKITILEIKQKQISEPQALANIKTELTALQQIAKQNGGDVPAVAPLKQQLLEINQALWTIEDDIRDCERNGDFSQRFIDLARSVYITNDKRAAVKRQLNTVLKSDFFEEKSYQDY